MELVDCTTGWSDGLCNNLTNVCYVILKILVSADYNALFSLHYYAKSWGTCNRKSGCPNDKNPLK